MKKDRDVYSRIANGIDDKYISEMLGTLQQTTVKEPDTRSWFLPLLVAVAVVVLLVMGTLNILHHQNREDIPAQTDWSAEEPKFISSSENNAETDARAEETSERDTESSSIENAKTSEGEPDTTRDEAELDAEIEELLNQMYPERSELYFEALAERNYIYYENEMTIEEYKKEQMEEYTQNNEKNKQRIYEYIAECMDGGETKEQVVERLRQWVQAYPELTDEQEKEFNERYEYYDECYRSCVETYNRNEMIEFIATALYYEEIGRSKEQLCVVFQLSVEEAGKLIDIEWTEVYAGDIKREWETVDFCYGKVSAASLLKLVEEGKIPKTLYVPEEISFPYINITYYGSIAEWVQYAKRHFGYFIGVLDGREAIGMRIFWEP